LYENKYLLKKTSELTNKHLDLYTIFYFPWGRRGRDRMVV